MPNKCSKCLKRILSHENSIKCGLCQQYIHVNCLPIYNEEDIEYARNPNNNWSCISCLKSLFPYNSVENNNDIQREINHTENQYDITLLDEMIINPFDIDEVNNDDDLDPDNNYFIPTYNQSLSSCKYYNIESLNKIIETKENPTLSIYSHNIRSLPKNSRALNSFLNIIDHKFNIVALTETWLKEHNTNLYIPEGYDHEFLIRNNKDGGGVSLMISNEINYKIRSDLNTNTVDFQLLWIEITENSQMNSKNTIIGVIYRRPGSDIETFNELLGKVLETIKNENKTCIHTGDYNLDLLKTDSHQLTNEFLNLNFAHSYIPLITKPTRVTPTSATLIDNIFTNNLDNNNFTNGILINDISDHFPTIYITHKYIYTPDGEPTRLKRSVNATNKKLFTETITQIDWSNVHNEPDAQKSYSKFHEKFTQAFQTCFPLRKVKTGYCNKLPWITPGLKKSIQKKHSLYAKYLKNSSRYNETIYKKYKNKLNHIMRSTERQYYQNELKKSQNNMRKSWQILKSVINKKKATQKPGRFLINGQLVDNPKLIANAFNDFFINIGQVLDRKIPRTQTNPNTFIPRRYSINIQLDPATEPEITKIIDNLRECATGWDDIPAIVLKENKNIIKGTLMHIINTSLSTGIFPSELKIANVIPLYKAGENEQITNYRPVSLLTTLSKIYEKIIYKRILDFLKEHNILYKNQFGFREKNSTYMAIINLLDCVINSLDEGNMATGIFIDFSKAFDTVNHRILINKLDTYGIRGTANKLIDSYLDNRKQYCTYIGEKSDYKTMKCGVPQGSILGPLLFLLYINDLAEIFTNIKPVLFADDSNLIITGNTVEQIEETANKELPELINWLNANRLSLNIKKTHSMTFTKSKHKIRHIPTIKLKGETLENITETKFLGVMVDSSLTWKSHINLTTKKIAKSIGILSKAKQYFNNKTLLQLYYSFIYPYLIYCNIIWGNANQTTLWPLYRLQKIAIRIISNTRRRNSTKQFCNKNRIIRLPEIYSYSVSIFMFKYTHNMLPTSLNNLFEKNNKFHNYPTRGSNNYRRRKTKSILADKFITTAGVNIWNSLIEKINPDQKISTFKKSLITDIVHSYIE